MPKRPTVSVIVPAYNEEARIAKCLDAILAQTAKPDEIIVVINNSTDKTESIVKKYRPHGVKMTYETQRGAAAARSKGFDEAKGDIICRTDADTFVDAGWVAAIITAAATSNAQYGAFTGPVSFYDVPFEGAINWGMKFISYDFNRWFIHQTAIHGGNMALTREVWHAVREQLCDPRGLAEDTDLAIHVRQAGYDVLFVPHMHASASARRYTTGITSFYKHLLLWSRVLRHHGMGAVGDWLLRLILFPTLSIASRPLRWLLLAYNPKTRRLSLRHFIRSFHASDRALPG